MTFGRTNRVFPPVWLRLTVPTDPGDDWIEPLVASALARKTVIDISTQPALWGGFLRGTEATLMATGRHDVERATSEAQAADYVQAHLIEILSAIGRDHIDFYFMPYRRALEEFQINGAFEALETARQDGIIRHLGLAPVGPPLAALGLWQFHDAFDAILLEPGESYESLAPMAAERRVGVVVRDPGVAGATRLAAFSDPTL
jgi:aryl-alcohol dehydrogenase-like predicted oxidoreductase